MSYLLDESKWDAEQRHRGKCYLATQKKDMENDDHQ